MSVDYNTERTLYVSSTCSGVMFHPKHSGWKAECAGVTYIPQYGQVPNRFWRMMQHLAFGFKWSKTE
jgi:hypothetical protein